MFLMKPRSSDTYLKATSPATVWTLVQPVDEAAARGRIFQEAAALYDQVNTSDYESERLQRLFEKAAHSTALDSQLLKSSVAGIYVESLSVKLLLWNGQYIGKDDFK